MVDEELLNVFLQEVEEELDRLEELLLALEQDPKDSELIDEIFRVVHTIKGSAGLTGLERISDFTHHLEEALEKMRTGELTADKELVDILLQAMDTLATMVSAVVGDKTRFPVEENSRITTLVNNYLNKDGGEAEGETESVPLVKEEEMPRFYHIYLRFPPDLFLTGTDPLMLLSELDEMGEIVETNLAIARLPGLEELDVHTLYLHWAVTLRTAHSKRELEDIFIFVAEESEIIIKDVTEQFENPERLGEKRTGEFLVDEGLIDREDLEEILTSQKRIGELLAEEGKVTPGQVEKVVAKQKKGRKALRSNTIRVDSEKLENMINLIAQLVIRQSRVRELVESGLCGGEPDPDLDSSFQEVDKTIRALQEQIMEANMVPVGDTFMRFRRLVRDLADDHQKEVRFEISGKETELDKKVIEKISDPLKHLLRNAVDHGIEPPRERKRAGKDPSGRIALRALQQEGGIIIEIEDDGQGLDREQIAAKAAEKGLIEDHEELSTEEIYRMIFEPGFSTRDEVSDVSGRGVGMDVVRTNIEELQGSIEVSSDSGQGTVFRIKLPLTLAIIDGMLIRVKDENIIVPLTSIVEFIAPSPERLKKVKGRGRVIEVRGEYIPLFALDDLLGMDSRRESESDGLVVTVRDAHRQLALLVDEVLGQKQVVIKSLEKNFTYIEGIAGATVLGNGEVALILDITSLSRLAVS